MATPFLKRTLPRGFYGRAALILIVPIITIQLVVSVVFLQRHFEDVTLQMTANMVRDLRLALERPDLADDLEINLLPEPGPMADDRVYYDLAGVVVQRGLREAFPQVQGIDLAKDKSWVMMGLPEVGTVTFSRRRVSASNPHQLLVLMVITSIVMTVVAFLFMRNQIRPIKRLAAAAEAFGRGRTIPYWPSGATEVRAAGMAFLDMRQRIDRHIEQRTLLLSGVSHDLRTPLTRMRLELSMMEGEEAEALARDVRDMQRMIDAFLEFARGDAEDDLSQVDPVELATKVRMNFARQGFDIEMKADRFPQGQSVAMRPMGVERALENLLRNALRYGIKTRLSVMPIGPAVGFVVEDDGPGIPAAAREAVTRPFARLDSARGASAEGNVGLGLAIVVDVARAHGGSLRLSDSPEMGGLRAELIIPR